MNKSNNNESEEAKTLRHSLNILKEGVWDWNASTGNVERSPGWYRMLGYDEDVLPNTVSTWEDIIHPDDYRSVMVHFENYINGLIDSYEIEYRCRKANSSYIWIRDQGEIVERNGDGSVLRMIGAHLDINDLKIAQLELQRQNELLSEDKLTLENLLEKRNSELEEANRNLEENLKKLSQLSNIDFLTSIYNRHKLEKEFENEMARSKRYGTPLAAVLFDVDNFKMINDTYGHQVGDLVLEKVSKLIINNIRETDIVGRWGGDEFFIIFPGINLEDTMITIEKIKCLIEKSKFHESAQVTCSFGVTEYITGDSIGSVYQRTDKALYNAKNDGRNIVRSN
jgi:diguanylate cyclase (GGDEF)-like protein/PAS domain S-box-containing protein